MTRTSYYPNSIFIFLIWKNFWFWFKDLKEIDISFGLVLNFVLHISRPLVSSSLKTFLGEYGSKLDHVLHITLFLFLLLTLYQLSPTCLNPPMFWNFLKNCILEICSKISNYMLHATSPQFIIPKKITNIIQNLDLFFKLITCLTQVLIFLKFKKNQDQNLDLLSF